MFVFLWLTVALLWARPANGQSSPQEASPCEIQAHPQSFDRKVVKIRGTVSLEFENFTIRSKACPQRPDIWLMFGGDVATPTPSTWNDIVRRPGPELNFQGVFYSLKKDASFRKFYGLITTARHEKAAYRVTATLTGTFFAGKEEKDSQGRPYLPGYGHKVCCHLLIITAISNVEANPERSPGVNGTVVSPSGQPLSGVTVETRSVLDPVYEKTTTDAAGRFSISYPGQVIRFRKDGFRPGSLILNRENPPLKMKLADSEGTDWVIPSCTIEKRDGQRIGFSSRYLLPKGTEWEQRQVDDNQAYFVRFRKEPGRLVIKPNQAEGIFDLDDGWLAASARFQQRWVKDIAGTIVGIDSRARLKWGKLWRSVRLFDLGSAKYEAIPQDAADYFDQILDSVCLPPPGRPPSQVP